MIRIGYLVSDYGAPSHTFVRREVAALRAQEIDIATFSVQRGGADTSEAAALLGRSPLVYLTALGWALLNRPGRFLSVWWLALRHRAPGWKALLWTQFHFVEAVLLARMLDAAAVRRLHIHFANSGATVGMLAAELVRLPWSLTLHGISETDYPAGLLLAAKIERASFVACASYFMRAQAMRLVASVHWTKMSVVRCGIDLATLPPPGPSAAGQVARIVCVGRLSPEKGYDGLLSALAAVAATGAAFELDVIGGGPLLDGLRARADGLDIGDRVRFGGPMSEADTLAGIAAADFLVLPSLMEGLPVVLVEAMALGKPVVASRVAGIPELVEEGSSGFMFAPSDWDELAAQLLRMIAARGDWAAMGIHGRERVAAAFRADYSATQMARLFAGEQGL